MGVSRQHWPDRPDYDDSNGDQEGARAAHPLPPEVN